MEDYKYNPEQIDLQLLARAMDEIDDWVLISDANGTIRYVNRAVERISGYSRSELVGGSLSKLKSDNLSASQFDVSESAEAMLKISADDMKEELVQHLWGGVDQGIAFQGVFANTNKNGQLYYIENKIYALGRSNIEEQSAEDEPRLFITIGKELDREDDRTNKIHDALHFDRLTGLLNRSYFLERLSEMCAGAEDGISVVAFKIRNLGLINKQHSFQYGERVIKRVTEVIEDMLDKQALFGRVHGNVFVLGLHHDAIQRTIDLVHQIERLFEEELAVKNQPIKVTLIFGIAHCVEQDQGCGHAKGSRDVAQLLANAQIALSQVRRINAIDRYAVYHADMGDQLQNRAEIEERIFAGYRNDEFIPYFQPIVDLNEDVIYSCEALIRWKKPTGELISPGEFIPVLEESGMVVEVGYQFVRKVCDFMNETFKNHGFWVPVSINLSSLQFKDPHFEERVLDYIASRNIPPNLVTFEITESTFIEDLGQTSEILEMIKARGHSVSIDDFGTGYSSLAYLQRFKVNTIKIDMSFIRNIVHNEGDQVIANAVLMMARGLGLRTVAEGVEETEQSEIVRKLGTDKGQGYLWSKPLPPEELVQFYQENHYAENEGEPMDPDHML